MKQLQAWLGEWLVTSITRRMLPPWHAFPAQKSRPNSANAIVERLEKIWEWAEVNDVLPAHATSAVRLFRRFDWYREIKRDRPLTEDEHRRFYAAIVHHRTKVDLSPKRLALFELLLVSGLRLREATFLRYNSGG